MIHVDNLSHAFGQFELRHVSLHLDAGTYGVLLGPSGAGKSVLLSLLAGAEQPTHGSIRFGELDVTGLPPERREVGMVFQKPSLFPHLSISENIGYGLSVRRVAPRPKRQRVEEVVDSLGIEDILARPVATLSGGEAQKVALARALAVRPAVLLLDEPLAPVDHNAREELRDVLGSLHRQWQLTTLHVTHSRDEARALGDFCAVMHEGRVVRAGPIEDVFTRPESSFVADFLGVKEGKDAP